MRDDKPVVENPGGVELPDTGEGLLLELFAGYRRLVVRKELSGGYSGCRLFVVRPVRPDGAELPAVVKMGPQPLIEREWRAYGDCIGNRLPGVAEIRGEPVYLSDWGALRYPLVGSGEFQVESLGQYGRHADIEDLIYVLKERLFKSMRANWHYHQSVADLSLRVSYDHVLPVNLFIEHVAPMPEAAVLPLTPATALNKEWVVDDVVALSGFRVTEIDPTLQTLTLNLPLPVDNGLPVSYRLRLDHVDNAAGYEVGQIVKLPLTGVVTATRLHVLYGELTRALGPEINLEAQRLDLSDGDSLPNPLPALPDLLRQVQDARVACVHGDLNLENVLVEYDRLSRNAHLIDFASARQDHVLHDLLRLETSFLLHLFVAAIDRPERLVALYRRVHCAMVQSGPIVPPEALDEPFAVLLAIRQEVRVHLYDFNDWREYYRGLVLYLLGTLKYKDLDNEQGVQIAPKQMAFWAAAAVQQLLVEQPPCEEIAMAEATIATERAGLFSIESVEIWLEHLFQWSKAPDHMRSSWAGKAIWALSAVTGRMTPQGWFAASLSLALWIVTAWTITPFYQWPLAADRARFLACVQFAAAAILAPLAMAVVTRPDYDTLIIRETWRQRLTLLLLKTAGALVGFGAFAGLLLFLAMALYYVTLSSLPAPVWWLLAAVPLLWSHITARRIPADRYKMYGHKPQMHPADKLFLVAFLSFGPLLATFVYFWYSVLAQRWMGIVLLLVIAFVAWREGKGSVER